MSARVPVAIGVGNKVQFELGIDADVVWFPAHRDLGAGLAAQLTSLGLSDSRRQVGLALAYMPDVGSDMRMGAGLDFGVASDTSAQYLYGRATYQLRGAIFGNEVDYVCSDALYIELRRSTSGPPAFEGSLGVELGGGLLLLLRRIRWD